jgi:FG-GAP-like repeat
MNLPKLRFARPGVETLEDRTLMNASFLGYSSVGNWETVALQSGNVVQVSTAAHWDPYAMVAMVEGDFTGNGQMDVAGWNELGYWTVGVPNGSGQFQTAQWESGFGAQMTWKTFLVGDFTGNGRDDIAMFSNTGQWWLAVSTGNSFQMQRWDVPGAWAPVSQWMDWQVGDFNGDGLADVAGLSSSGAWKVGISTGTSFQAQTWLPSKSWPIALPALDTFVGDFNGDGRSDLAGFFPSGQLWVALSTGTSFTVQIWAKNLPKGPNWLSFHTGDFNGDGFTDLAALDRLGNLWVFSSTGSSFNLSEWSARLPLAGTPLRLTVGDFNGDGKDDIAVITTSNQCGIALSDGTGFTYVGAAALGQGPWAYTFSTDRLEPDRYVNRHAELLVHSMGRYITATDMATLKSDPAYFATIFQDYQYELSAELGPAFSGIGQNGLAFSLATIVAYQSASYGVPPTPNLNSVAAMLKLNNLVCNQYCVLAAELYRIAIPAAQDPGTTIKQVGFGSGPFGNHAQLVFTSGSVSILGDPTLGLVALASFSSLRQGVPVPASNIRQLIDRIEVSFALQFTMAAFRNDVYNALRDGLYPEEWLIYTYDDTNL